jgi:hypothetical protein
VASTKTGDCWTKNGCSMARKPWVQIGGVLTPSVQTGVAPKLSVPIVAEHSPWAPTDVAPTLSVLIVEVQKSSVQTDVAPRFSVSTVGVQKHAVQTDAEQKPWALTGEVQCSPSVQTVTALLPEVLSTWVRPFVAASAGFQHRVY